MPFPSLRFHKETQIPPSVPAAARNALLPMELRKRTRKNRNEPRDERTQKPEDRTARRKVHDEKQQHGDQKQAE
jgi:hypothetical protein